MDINKHVDVAIVGAGPAGAMAACLLAARGFSVLLVDKKPFPRAKACGGCVNATAIRLLRAHSLGDALKDALPLNGLHLHSERGSLTIPTPAGLAIDRATFDYRLVCLAEGRGATFLPATSARLLPADSPDYRRLDLESDGQGSGTVMARLVFAADGLRGTLLHGEPWAAVEKPLLPRLGFATTLDRSTCDILEANPGSTRKPAGCHPGLVPANVISMFLSGRDYVGVVRFPGGALHVAASLDAKAIHETGPGAMINQIFTRCGWALRVPASARFLGTPPLNARRRQLAGFRVMALGDACGYLEPFTGQGIAWAIQSAVAAVELLSQSLAEWPADMRQRWAAAHRAAVGPGQQWCTRLHLLFDHAALTRAAFRAARAFPKIPARLAKHIAAA